MTRSASAFGKLGAKLEPQAAVKAPRVKTLRDFLENHARVKIMGGTDAGTYRSYSFEGREALREIVNVIDHVLGSETGKPLKDSTITLAGGAQFGKTTLELNIAAYASACRFLNPIVYLPDDKLVEGIVDSKFRPDVLDQVPWFAEMTRVGRAVNKSGKAVNTKGAFLVTNGQRQSVGMFRGLQKPPTSFSADIVIEDEKDDIPPKNAKFLAGRMTNSPLRLSFKIGTQRVHGAGQNLEWKRGSQGVTLVAPKSVWHAGVDATLFRNDHGHTHVSKIPAGFVNPEETWPQICRVAVSGTPRTDDPVLGYEGDFRRPWIDKDHVVATHKPDALYYYADPKTGEPLNIDRPVWHHRRPEQLEARNYSFRVAQIGTGAIDLGQIVAHWVRATGDAEEMVAFCCDRLAIPKSAAQALTPEILERSRAADPFHYGTRRDGVPRFAGLDTGDRCWYVCRETAGPADKRLVTASQIAVGDLVGRVVSQFRADGAAVLFIDERPAVSEARTIALALNGLTDCDTWPAVDWRSRDAYVALPGGLTWDGRQQRWLNLRCAVVRFTKNQLGAGIEQGAAEFVENGRTKFVPMIACNRFETIDRVVREFLTPKENVLESVEIEPGKRAIREQPAMRLPIQRPGAPVILEAVASHFLAGSQRVKDEKTGQLGEYVDGVDNHFLLADGYSALAETIGGAAKAEKFNYERVERNAGGREPIRAGRGVLI